ncbi:Predicted flavoprotein CzcO associated with the cation diffusion facilitator CzcD [Micromonospora pattaloongensis]|uniref:Predicted flavoprotein CzcO associated with the cation diffusion facilitator CzcD n=1 Tax=Micromonospora pattaloongensis TaxID=405436 RepID=A0A1H3RSD9_9ACTN|nr:NAD(P)/FAD-dependent oxidoreductase [Micromonospora pattaloongensis]SDZ28158.1 Predicted flavoprotein CzcO associated with the cation diffusion facilitator CzcD [Micromonospora pattaloongensis]
MTTDERHSHIAIIGAGFGGIGAAIRLRREGYRDFVVFDRGGDVGGTWRDNSYPGCACDVPSHMYSLSFAPNPEWSRSFSGQAEIWAYLRRCVAEHGVRPHLRLEHEVHAAAWDDAAGRWVIDTSQGRYTAEFLVAAGGPLSEPSIPNLPGLETFAGEVFHSARWNHDHDLTGRRVAVIGTGASAIQFVPRIAPAVERLHLFQRTPPWVMPRADRAVTGIEKRLFRHVPGAQRLARAGVYWGREAMAVGFLHPAVMRVAQRIARTHLNRAIKDPALRAKLTPSYTMGCKRVLLSNDYYPALARDNVDVVTDGIAEIRPEGVVTRDGSLHEADTIIFGTGFHVTDMPLAQRLRGRDGRTLADTWRDTMRAYQGTSVTGFPNLFFLLGPNTGLGHTSVVFMIECQIGYLLGMLRHLRATGVRAIEPTPEAQADFVARVDRKMGGTVWSRGGCRSWYLDATGRNSTLWPGYTWSYWLRTRRFDAAAYRPVPVAQRVGVAAGAEEAR